MPGYLPSMEINLRKVTKEYFTVSVQYKGKGFFKLGLFLIKLGCKIGGFNFVDEFPISLLDSEGNPMERKEK